MLKSILVLPDGRELSSGAQQEQPLMAVTLTESVNNHEELTMGAVFANILEAKVNTCLKSLELTAGDEVVLYKEDDEGLRHKIGIFILEKPTRPTADTMQLRGFDRVIGLNRDLSAWLSGLDAWPYRLIDFAGMVCNACGLELVTESIPNEGFWVQQFSAEVTGYQLMRWIGEVCCRFCRASAEGKIELAWYTPAGISITPSGDVFYFQNSLHYEQYQVEPVDAVQVRLADHASGALWPQVEEGANVYIIEGNPILRARVTEELLPVLQTIQQELPREPYRPFQVTVPATLGIRAGNSLQITDKNGVTFAAYVMFKEQTGQKDTLECTGNPRRDSTAVQHEKTEQEKTAAMKGYADNAAGAAESAANSYTNQKALQTQTAAQEYTNALDRRLDQAGVFNRLTNNGACQGLFMQDGQLYVNASYIKTGSIVSEGQAYLPPTHEDAMTMLWSLSFPDRYPPKDFYDLNGDGVFDRDDVMLAKDVYLGKRDISTCPGAYKTGVTVTIEPTNPQKAVLITGVNMWGSEVSVYLGTGGTSIPTIAGDCSVGGKLAVGDYAILQSIATEVEQAPKALSWKDNGDGTFTLIGT